MAFCKAGYCVRLATSAEEALEILRKENISVIFVDIGLEKMNGFELCGHIRKDNPRALIYALSGYPELFLPQDISDGGFNDYFSKPISIENLYKVVKDSLRRYNNCLTLRSFKL